MVRRSLIRYQRRGKNLVRVGFRPDLNDWLDLGQFALLCGTSRCLAFMILYRALLRKKSTVSIRARLTLVLWRDAGELCRGPIELFAPDFRGEIREEVPDGHVSGKPW